MRNLRNVALIGLGSEQLLLRVILGPYFNIKVLITSPPELQRSNFGSRINTFRIWLKLGSRWAHPVTALVVIFKSRALDPMSRALCRTGLCKVIRLGRTFGLLRPSYLHNLLPSAMHHMNNENNHRLISCDSYSGVGWSRSASSLHVEDSLTRLLHIWSTFSPSFVENTQALIKTFTASPQPESFESRTYRRHAHFWDVRQCHSIAHSYSGIKSTIWTHNGLFNFSRKSKSQTLQYLLRRQIYPSYSQDSLNLVSNIKISSASAWLGRFFNLSGLIWSLQVAVLWACQVTA